MDLSPEEQRRTVISSRLIDAPIDEVFDAYANPEKLVRWWGPNGFTLVTESLDLHEGGHWRFVFTGPDGATYTNHLVFQKIERPHLFVVDHLSGPIYHGTVTFDDVGSTTRVTMYWTLENVDVFDKIRDTVIAGNEGNFDRLSAVVAGHRFVFTIHVDDVDALCAELTARGVELLNGPTDRPWGVRTASFVDPGGHIWEIAK